MLTEVNDTALGIARNHLGNRAEVAQRRYTEYEKLLAEAEANPISRLPEHPQYHAHMERLADLKFRTEYWYKTWQNAELAFEYAD